MSTSSSPPAAPDPAGDPRCVLCGTPIPRAEARACGLCAAPHHGDCWAYTGMCSAFGCGGIAEVAWSRDLVPVEVEIDGRGGGALAARTAWTSLDRRLRARAKDLPATLRAGFTGGVVAFAGMMAAITVLRPHWDLTSVRLWTRFLGPYLQTLLAAGVGYGLVSPFVAPLQHRHPGLVAVGTGLLAVATYMLPARTTLTVLFVAAILGTFSAATLGEWLVGPHRPLGRRLGRLATPLRYLFIGGLFFACGFAAALAKGFPVSVGLTVECLAWSLLAGVAGGHALEVGKEEYRKHLVALVEGPAEEEAEDLG